MRRLLHHNPAEKRMDPEVLQWNGLSWVPKAAYDALGNEVRQLEAALETKIGPDKKDVSPAVARAMSKFWAGLADRIERECSQSDAAEKHG